MQLAWMGIYKSFNNRYLVQSRSWGLSFRKPRTRPSRWPSAASRWSWWRQRRPSGSWKATTMPESSLRRGRCLRGRRVSCWMVKVWSFWYEFKLTFLTKTTQLIRLLKLYNFANYFKNILFLSMLFYTVFKIFDWHKISEWMEDERG